MARINQAMQAGNYSGGYGGGDAENMRMPKAVIATTRGDVDSVQAPPTHEPTHADQLSFCQGRIHSLEQGLVDAHQQIQFMRERLGI